MASEPLPDHYKALGVDKTADAATIKAIYRKLVLKCHPDKVTDPALKEQKQDEFHQIQQAYEVLIDQDKREDYEANLKLESLRRENAAAKAARGAAPREKTARFEQRTAGGASFTSNGPSRYNTEERHPPGSKPRDDYYDDRARSKYETYPTYPPKSSAAPRSSREKESSRSARPHATDRTRSEREKTRAKDARSDRKFVSVERESDSSSDDKARYEAEYKRRSAEDEARRQADDRRPYEDSRYAAAPTHRKMSAQAEEAIRYQHKSRTQVEDEMARPTPVRTSSRDYYAPEHRSSRHESSRPEPVRRSSARPGKERPSVSRRETDRGIPEVVEWAEEGRNDDRRPAEVSRGMPPRSYTDSSSLHRHVENSPPPPAFLRSATMPSVPHSSSSRRKEQTVPRPSGLREAMTPEHYSSPERDAFPTVPPPQPSSASKKTYYSYAAPGAGVPIRAEEIGRHTTVREPGRHLHRSPSPIGKPPIGANRPPESATSYKTTTTRPSMGGRTESSRNLSPARGEDRGRSARPKLYGEMPTRGGRQSSYSPSEVQYSRKYGPEDVRWAPKSSENERGYASKPTLGRTATYVY